MNVNHKPLLATPPTVTTTFPVVAPVGTVAVIDVAPQFVIVVAVVPLNATVLELWVDPKFVPVIATDVLSEGQNLQDASIVVNFDLPWAIIRRSSSARSQNGCQS